MDYYIAPLSTDLTNKPYFQCNEQYTWGSKVEDTSYYVPSPNVGVMFPLTPASCTPASILFLASSSLSRSQLEPLRRSRMMTSSYGVSPGSRWGRFRVTVAELQLKRLFYTCSAPNVYANCIIWPLGLSNEKSCFNFLEFAINRFFMKSFRTSDINIVKSCQLYFCFNLPCELLKDRA